MEPCREDQRERNGNEKERGRQTDEQGERNRCVPYYFTVGVAKQFFVFDSK